MAPRKTNKGRKVIIVKKAKKAARRRVPRAIGNPQNQHATIIESFDTDGELTANFNVNLNAFSLGQFPRATQVS